MNLTAIIACKNRHRNIRYCINSAVSTTPPPYVIVVDFGSDPPISTILSKDLPKTRIIRVVRNTNMFHKARALNIGIREVETKFICITDADQIFSANFFGTVYNYLKVNPKRFVQCYTYFLEEMLDISFSEVRKKYKVFLNLAKKQKKRKLRGYGCCHGVLTSWFKKVRGYDEETYHGWGAEDRDLEMRAKYAGLDFIWAHNITNMVHLPHSIDGEYYDKKLIQRNLDKYNRLWNLTSEQEKICHIVANQNVEWGKI